MKRTIIVAIVAVLIGIALWIVFGFSPQEIRNYPSSGTEVIAFGDSLIEGVGSVDGGDLVSLLSEKTGVPIKNFGRSGDTTELALERLPVVLDEVPHPKVVIVLLGGNDFLRKIPKTQTFSNMEKIISSFQERGAVVIILGIRGGIFKDNFQKEFENLSKVYATGYVPNVLSGLIGRSEYMYDSIHPNNIGYKRVADRVYPVLSKLIN